jgi:hypothetical protein
MTVFEELQIKCKNAGVTLNKICTLADVPISSVYWWRKQEPNQITQLRKLEAELERLKK